MNMRRCELGTSQFQKTKSPAHGELVTLAVDLGKRAQLAFPLAMSGFEMRGVSSCHLQRGTSRSNARVATRSYHYGNKTRRG